MCAIKTYRRAAAKVTRKLTKILDSLLCHWKVNKELSNRPNQADTSCHTVDVLFCPVAMVPRFDGSTLAPGPYLPPAWTTPKAGAFVEKAVRRNMDACQTTYTAFKLLLPAEEGYAIRNDTVQRRFLTCELADEVGDFASPRQPIHPFTPDDHQDGFPGVLHAAIGAILLKPLPGLHLPLVESALSVLEDEVTARLSFPWIASAPLPKLRIAVIEGRRNPVVAEAAGTGMYRAARALGIDLVILERDVAWARSYAVESGGCDEFLACDMSLDEGLADRVVDALSKSRGPIDGLTTFNDYYVVKAVEAAKKLGLPCTNSVEALERCHDKGKMRDAIMADKTLSVSGVADLKAQLTKLSSPLEYPVVIKPVVGCASDGVRKITSESELFEALQRHEKDFQGVDALIEPYESGPEVDVNFVLWGGQNIWSEVVDDLPSSADFQPTSPSHTTNEPSQALPLSFAETSVILPSALPASESSLLQSSLHKTLLGLGLQNGVFHVEARVKNSSKAYAVTDSGMQLVDAPGQAERREASVFLLEINARLPGHQESYSVEYTYGIDYFALHMLMALAKDDEHALESDVGRIVRALSQPLEPVAQHATHVVFVTASRGGTFAATKPLPEPLARYITHSTVYKKKGDVLSDPFTEGRWHFLAYFGVTAKCGGEQGRVLASGVGEIVRQSFEYVVDQ